MNTGDTAWLLMATALVLLMMTATALIMYGLKFMLGLRPREISSGGIDTLEHGERAYDGTLPAQQTLS